MEYTIKAIPTMYRGRQYRSRLEARWAAFFDELGWHAEYEPCDLGAWSPDFALWGCRQEDPHLAEVKPITEWHRATARKMADAVGDEGGYVLLLGLGPKVSYGSCRIGWLGVPAEYEYQWTEAIIELDDQDRPDLRPGSDGPLWCPQGLFWESIACSRPFDARPLWKEAANRVQWRGPKAIP
jgi:hypothetical protein